MVDSRVSERERFIKPRVFWFFFSAPNRRFASSRTNSNVFQLRKRMVKIFNSKVASTFRFSFFVSMVLENIKLYNKNHINFSSFSKKPSDRHGAIAELSSISNAFECK